MAAGCSAAASGVQNPAKHQPLQYNCLLTKHLNHTLPSLQCVTIVAISKDNISSLKPLQKGAVGRHFVASDRVVVGQTSFNAVTWYSSGSVWDLDNGQPTSIQMENFQQLDNGFKYESYMSYETTCWRNVQIWLF